MRTAQFLFLALASLCLIMTGCNRNKTKLSGAGATFPGILYEKWCNEFTEKKGIQVEYQKLGSGKGESMVVEGTIDFGGSDAPNADELEGKVKKGLVFLPMTAGAIVLSYNLEGVENLKLSQEAVAGIFQGTIKKWNEEPIAKHNPGVKLPAKDIAVVVRNEKSGTTEIFTGFLSAISPDFAKKPGKSKEPNWTLGSAVIKGQGNDGVMSQIQQVPNSIGYVEYGYAKNKPMAWLQNEAGEFVEPGTKGFQEALKAIELPDNLVGFEFKVKGKDSYPIVTYTWMMVYKKYDDAKKADAVKEFVRFGLHDGQKYAADLGYIPLPGTVVSRVEKALDKIGH